MFHSFLNSAWLVKTFLVTSWALHKGIRTLNTRMSPQSMLSIHCSILVCSVYAASKFFYRRNRFNPWSPPAWMSNYFPLVQRLSFLQSFQILVIGVASCLGDRSLKRDKLSPLPHVSHVQSTQPPPVQMFDCLCGRHSHHA